MSIAKSVYTRRPSRLLSLQAVIIIWALISILIPDTPNCQALGIHEIIDNVVCIEPRRPGSPPGLGTGIILNNEGYCATAYHVVRYAERLKIRSLRHRSHCNKRVNELLSEGQYSIREDAAVLKLPDEFLNSHQYNLVTRVASLSRELLAKDVCWWTACTGGALKYGKISYFENPKKIWAGCSGQRLKKGDSGSPVVLTETGELVGLIGFGINSVPVIDDNSKDTLWWLQEDIGLVTVASIDPLLPENPGHLLVRDTGLPQDFADSSTTKQVYADLDALESYMSMIKERKSLLFHDKFRVDLGIFATLEASSFINRMRQAREKGVQLTRDRALAVRYFVRGLETKATKRNGFDEALEFFRLAMEADSSFVDPVYQLALYNLTYTDSTERARRELMSVLDRDPYNPEAVLYLAALHLMIGDYVSGATYLSKADSLLPDNDPRIPLYWGVYYDPFFRPGTSDTGRLLDVNAARIWYIRSAQKEPHLILPANNLICTFYGELEQDDTLGTLSKQQREDLECKLRSGLGIVRPYIEWGFRDPRVLETFAHAHAYLSKIGTDLENRREDCSLACQYVSLIEESMEEIELRPSQAQAVQQGTQNVITTCDCRRKVE